MLLLFLFVLLLFVCLFVFLIFSFFCFRNNNMISIGTVETVEFRYCVVIRQGLRQLRLISFQ